jgi:hypothetical protein
VLLTSKGLVVDVVVDVDVDGCRGVLISKGIMSTKTHLNTGGGQPILGWGEKEEERGLKGAIYMYSDFEHSEHFGRPSS